MIYVLSLDVLASNNDQFLDVWNENGGNSIFLEADRGPKNMIFG